jgi:hypothetical protein
MKGIAYITHFVPAGKVQLTAVFEQDHQSKCSSHDLISSDPPDPKRLTI